MKKMRRLRFPTLFRTERPHAKVLLTCGYTIEASGPDAGLNDIKLLSKPYPCAKLGCAIHAALS